MQNFIPVNQPLLSGKEGKYLQECIDTGYVSSEGPFVAAFEKEFARYTGREYGITCANGSAALDIAIAALQLGKGDEVILPTFTIISPALSIVRAGATPVLVDSQSDTWNMNVEQVEAKITSRTKAILVVHIYGLPVDMNPIVALCEKHGLYLIEDAAEVIGQTYYDRKCGTFGAISVFSFYPNKHITTGEGGMCLTDDTTLAARCTKLRNLAFEPQGRRFVHEEMGWNYRMTNLQAAVGLAQLENIEQHLALKRTLGAAYQAALQNLKGFTLPLEKTDYADNIYWIFGLVAEDEALAERAVTHLNAKGIATRPFFWCMHEQPVFRKMGLFFNEKFPIAERIARCGFYLPSGLGLTLQDIAIVSDCIKSFVHATIENSRLFE